LTLTVSEPTGAVNGTVQTRPLAPAVQSGEFTDTSEYTAVAPLTEIPTDTVEGDTNFGTRRFDDAAGGVRFGMTRTAFPCVVIELPTIGAVVATGLGPELLPPPHAAASNPSAANAADRSIITIDERNKPPSLYDPRSNDRAQFTNSPTDPCPNERLLTLI
jgi:hypothetical protein